MSSADGGHIHGADGLECQLETLHTHCTSDQDKVGGRLCIGRMFECPGQAWTVEIVPRTLNRPLYLVARMAKSIHPLICIAYVSCSALVSLCACRVVL